MQTLAEDLLRRHCRLLDRVEAAEAWKGADSEMAEKAVRQLIAFEEDAGSALDAAIVNCPPPVVRLRVNGSEAVYQEE